MNGLAVVRNPAIAVPVIAGAATVWTLTIILQWTVLRAFQPAAGLIDAAVFVAVVSVGGAIPAAPGAIGTYQWVGQQALTLPFPVLYPPPLALAVAVVSHAASYSLQHAAGSGRRLVSWDPTGSDSARRSCSSRWPARHCDIFPTEFDSFAERTARSGRPQKMSCDRRGRVHRQPPGRASARRRPRGPGHRQFEHRPPAQPRAPEGQSEAELPRSRHRRSGGHCAGVRGRATGSSTWRRSPTSCRRSSSRWRITARTSTAPSRCSSARATPASSGFSIRRRRPVTASPTSFRRPRPRRSGRSIPTR